MSGDGNFRWWWSENQEDWTPAPTREAAIAAARARCEGGAFYICKADQEAFTDDIFSADDIKDMFEVHNEEVLNPDDTLPSDLPDEAWAELTGALRDTFAAWRQKHQPWKPWALANIQNEEHFPAERGVTE